MHTDDIYVRYDNGTLYADTVFWYYSGNEDDSIEWKARLLGFFATMEYGAPIKRTESEISDAKKAALPAYEDYVNAIVDRESELLNGDMVLFRVSEAGIYYITLDNLGLVIMAK